MTLLVRGTLRNPDGSPVSGALVKAFDVALRAEALLGESRTGTDGGFEVRYTREALRPGGKGAADLVVHAYADRTGEIARSDLICRAPSEATVDLVVGNRPLRGPSEYDAVLAAIRPYFGDIALADLEREDVRFLACSSGTDRQKIATLVVASRLARETSLPDRLFYALGRQGVRLQLEAMVLLRRTALNDAFNAAVAANIVSVGPDEDANALLDRLQSVLVREAFNPERARTTLTAGAVLATSLVSPDVQEAFLVKFVSRRDSAEEFWKSVGEDQRFSKEAIQDLRLTLLIGRLTRYRISVLEHLKRLRENGELKSLRDLVRVSRTRWREILLAAARDDGLEPPADIPGETAEDRLEPYITSLRAPIASLFPSDSLRTALAVAPDTEPNLARFLSNAGDLDLYWTDIDSYLRDHRETALAGIPAADHDAVIARAGRMQRLLRVSRRADTVRVLDAAGFDSALAIARTPRARFQRRFVAAAEQLKETLADAYVVTLRPSDGDGEPQATLMMMNSSATPAAVADNVHGTSVAISAANLQQFVNLHTAFQTWPEAIGGGVDLQRKLKADAWKEIPDLETLFGSQSFCECEHCRSVYSPAAYLVDLLHFLDDLTKKTDGTLKYARPIDAPTPIHELLRRRSDIAHIPLTCENTNTPLPYVDLVNEALESFVASHLSGSGDWTDVVLANMPIQPHDTGAATSAELRAVPQHVQPEVYAHLGRKAAYPMALPFHRPLEVARAYLAQLGVRRIQIMEAFRTPKTDAAPAAPSELAAIIERIGMNPAQYQIVAATSSTDPVFNQTDGLKDLWVYYGYGSAAGLANLEKVPTLLHRVGLSFDELIALLKTRFLNPKVYSPGEATPDTKVVTIAFPSSLADDACDVSKMTLTNLDPAGDAAFAHEWLGRLHRFVRLTRALGWSVADVDRAMAAIAGGLNDAALEKLAALNELASALERPVTALLVLFADLDTWGVEIETDPITGTPKVIHRDESVYAQLFLNRTVVTDPALRKVFEDALLNKPAGTLETHAAGVAAALAITAGDLERIRQHAGLAENAPLSVTNLSVFSRYAALSHALGIRIRDLVTLLRLVEVSALPFQQNDPRPPLEFARIARSVESSGFPIALLNYLFRDEPEPTRHPAPTRALVKTTLTNLQKGLSGIYHELAVAEQPVPDTLRARLEIAGPALELDVPAGVERALAVLDPRQTIFQGQDLTLAYRQQFATAHFASFLPNPAATLFGSPQSLPTDPAEGEKRSLENAKTVLDALVPWLRRLLQRTFVVSTMADAMGVEHDVMQQLLEKHLVSTDPQQPGAALDYLLTLIDATGHPIDLHVDDEPLKPAALMVFRVFKAAAYVNGFGMTTRELDLFAGSTSPLRATPESAAVLALNLNDLPLAGAPPPSSPEKLFQIWRALRGFYELRAALPRSERTVVDYFATSGSDAKIDVLEEATGWEKTAVKGVLLKAFGSSTLPDTVPALIRLHRAMTLLRRVGATQAQLFAWAGTTPDHEQAEAIVQTVKARYDTRTWLDLARALNDPLREKQRDALVAFLIPRITGAPFPIETPNDLFEYFLIDVEMSSCMLTSRIKQAISSVQLFVQRCLLNLEPGVSPDEIDPERWKWMKHYRVAEANRKVFVQTENYTFSELRDDKTPFFKELETELLQGELTDERIEKAVTNYLYRLDDVARLDIRGFCTETIGDDEIYHVFGRTWNPPYSYFYRRGRITKGSPDFDWSAWERVELDIQGDHLLPVVYEARLYLFWTVFDEKPAANTSPSDPVSDITADSKSHDDTYWSLKLQWATLDGHQWSPKKTSKDAANLDLIMKNTIGGLWNPPAWYTLNEKVDGEKLTIGAYSASVAGITDFFVAPLKPKGQAFGLNSCKGELHTEVAGAQEETLRPKNATVSGQFFKIPHSITTGLQLKATKTEAQTTIFQKLPDDGRLVPEQFPFDLWASWFIQDEGHTYLARPVVEVNQPIAVAGVAVDSTLKEAAIMHTQSFDEVWGHDPVGVLAGAALNSGLG